MKWPAQFFANLLLATNNMNKDVLHNPFLISISVVDTVFLNTTVEDEMYFCLIALRMATPTDYEPVRLSAITEVDVGLQEALKLNK